jgi:hypothetical protein
VLKITGLRIKKMKKIMHLLFLSCIKATELIEKRFHFQLSVKENLQLKMHKMMCDACMKYEKQSAFIEKGISNMGKVNTTTPDIDSLKDRISKKLEHINES